MRTKGRNELFGTRRRVWTQYIVEKETLKGTEVKPSTFRPNPWGTHIPDSKIIET